MQKKVRSHSALLLLLAPVLAIGSSFLVAGSANATVKTAKNVKPTITVCKSISASLHFTINGKLMSLNKECSAVAGKAGINHITESWAPASYRNLESISVSPSAARVGTSVKTATATVRLTAHGAATVRFVNAKVVTEVINRVTGHATGTGTIEVCKTATSDDWVQGSFPFTISAGGATVGTVSVPVNSCSGPVSVPAGTVTVTESNEFPYYVSSVSSYPTLAVGSATLYGGAGQQVLPSDASGGSASFTVNATQDVTAIFNNSTSLGAYKVCKVLANDQGSLAGSVFNYNVGWVFTPPTAGSSAISWSGTASVVAVDSSVSGGNCSLPYLAPAGATVTVSEQAFPNVAVVGVPAIAGDGTIVSDTNNSAVFTVPTDGSVEAATFTNDPLGTIEVCKNFYNPPFTDLNYNTNNSAEFTVNGGASFWVDGGACSAPISVPAGTATVTEASESDFFLWNVSTFSATDVFGTRLLTGDTVNPATVTVPYGGAANETVVTFTNAVDPTQFKICKQESSADANLSGDTFNFAWGYSDGNYDISGSGEVSLTIAPVTATNPTGLVCSGLIWGPPAVDPSGDSINVGVTELSTPILDVAVSSIGYQGNGSVIYDGAPADVTNSEVGYCFDPVNIDTGAVSPISIVTFTNSRTDETGPTGITGFTG